jgi:hypothetical protein
MLLLTSTIRFPEIALATRDAHKLRGYFGNLFMDKSPLLHNHFKDGSLVFKYPLVQYKVVNNIPILIGLNEGAELLTSLFLQIRELKIEDKSYFINYKNIENKKVDTGVKDDLFNYKFVTLWMGLNQKNFPSYKILKKENDTEAINEMFKSILKGNILSFFKSINYTEAERINVLPKFKEKKTKFKGIDMIAFEGEFTANVNLPDLIGLGKSVSRGFGTIIKVQK